eukprot:12406943-Karenia_brevis.AAC.1
MSSKAEGAQPQKHTQSGFEESPLKKNKKAAPGPIMAAAAASDDWGVSQAVATPSREKAPLEDDSA